MLISQLFIDLPIAFAAGSALSLSVAVVGFAAGAYLGSLNRTADPNRPLALGVICGALCYVAAATLVVVAMAVLVGGLIVAVFVYRPVIEGTLATFARAAGRRFTTRHFRSRGVQVTDEFSQRQAFFEELPIEPDQREQLRKKDQSQFCNAIERLGSQYPYVADDASHASGGDPLEDLYNSE